MKVRYIVGVDEAGRGPLAGPVSVGVVAIPVKLSKNYKNIKNSTLLSKKRREEWFSVLKKERKEGKLNWGGSTVSHLIVDRDGISRAVRVAIRRSLKKIDVEPKECRILLDGGLKAPKEFAFQETFIRGDERISIIALASIVAKVYRDKKMTRLAKVYPEFKFDIHKGYGTKLHRRLIRKYGPSPIPRISFLTRILTK